MLGKTKLSSYPLSKLELDINNPRLIGYRKQNKINNENDIIALMLSVYGVKELIFSILTNGFHPDEVLYSIPNDENNKKIIVEGNRRLTACKIIKKPSYLKKIGQNNLCVRIKNHKNYTLALESISKLNVVELKNRTTARTYIASKHTKESIKRWSVYTQGAYYIDLMQEYRDINALRASINNSVSSSRIRGVIFFSQITDEILSLPTLSDIEKETLLSDIDNIKVEAIIRLIQRTDFKSRIARISLNKNGELSVKDIIPQAYQILLAKLARDANFSKELTTRQEDDEKIKKYIADLEKTLTLFDKPERDLLDDTEEDEYDLNLDEEETPEDTDENGSEYAEPDQNVTTPTDQVKPKPKIIKKSTYLIERTISSSGHKKLDRLLDEAKRLNFLKFKYSSIILSRTIIETVMSILIKRSTVHDEYKAYSKFNYLQLDTLLDYYANNLVKIFPEDDKTPSIKLIKHTLSSYKETGKLVSNLATHNEDHSLTEQEVTHVREKLHDLIAYFLPKFITGQ